MFNSAKIAKRLRDFILEYEKKKTKNEFGPTTDRINHIIEPQFCIESH